MSDPSSRRLALQERTESQANQRPAASLRVVGQPEASVYETSPFPSKPSQVLRPSRKSPVKAAPPATSPPRPLQSSGWGASSLFYASRGPFGGTNEPPTGPRAHRSSADVSFYSTSTEDSFFKDSPDVRTNTSLLTEESTEREDSYEEYDDAYNGKRQQYSEESLGKGKVRDLGITVPSTTVPDRPLQHQHQALDPVSPDTESEISRQPMNKDSDGSLGSLNSTGTVIVKKPRDGRKRASYSAFPPPLRPSSSKSSASTMTPPRTTRKASDESGNQPSPVSPGSLVSSSPGPSNEAALPPSPYAAHGKRGSGELQYPVLRDQQISPSWAESSSNAHGQSRAAERQQEKWNPHLSTVQSEGASSLSGERSSQATGIASTSRYSDGSSNVLSDLRMSTDYPPVPNRSPRRESTSTLNQANLAQVGSNDPAIAVPAPLRLRDASGSTIRMVPQEEPAAISTPQQPRDVSATSVRVVDQRDEAGPSSTISPTRNLHNIRVVPQESSKQSHFRPTSRASFFRDNIPAWAKTYYGRPTSSATLSRPDSRRFSVSTDNISLNLHRGQGAPGVKPRELRRSKMRIGPSTLAADPANIRASSGRRYSATWSPHLWHHRSSMIRRRTVFIPPSLDERAEGMAMTKRNAQVTCFVLGFLLPPVWLVASFLPLPRRPIVRDEKGKKINTNSQVIEDLESQLAPVDDARYENARWWRNINRGMSLAGLLIIIAIIVLAVVGAT